MKRIHFFEWEDQPWFPNSWRDYGTDYLRFIASKFNIYEPVLPLIRKGIGASGNSHWVDCASGGGSGLVGLAKTLAQEYPGLKITLTDFYPNLEAFERTKALQPGIFEFERASVNAMDLPPHLHGKFRTLFGAFHHFRQADAQKILQHAIDTRSPIAIFEPVGRDLPSWLSMLFVIPNVLLLTPFIRPFRWQVLPFIYLLPLIPLYILWDGCVSIMRTYSARERQAMVGQLRNADSFAWEVGSAKAGPSAIHYLVGVPK